MFDVIEKIGNSEIQFGHFNKRIYIMKLYESDFEEVMKRVNTIMAANKFTKIFAKISVDLEIEFINMGYEVEAKIPQFFNGTKDVLFVGKYFNSQRKALTCENEKLIRNVILSSKKKAMKKSSQLLSKEFNIRILSESDIGNMSHLYCKVFDSYPFPIFNPEYLAETMQKNVVYFGAFDKNNFLVSTSSAEMDIISSNVEMTDFATLPEYRGNGLALLLLKKMEEAMAEFNISTFHTIARAYSYGMNITFARNGYTFCGTLYNNTNISGQIESMNVWYKFRNSEVSKEDENALF